MRRSALLLSSYQGIRLRWQPARIQSEELTVRVFKKSTAGPAIVFSPASLSTYTSEPVMIRAEADFSSCPVAKEAMLFSWSQLSGPSRVDTLALKPQAQLALPKHVLKASSTYEFQVEVSMIGDPLVRTLGTFSVEVKSLPLSARISGPIEVSPPPLPPPTRKWVCKFLSLAHVSGCHLLAL